MLNHAHGMEFEAIVPLGEAEIECVTGGAVLIYVEKYDKFGEAYLCPVWVSEVEAAFIGGGNA